MGKTFPKYMKNITEVQKEEEHSARKNANKTTLGPPG